MHQAKISTEGDDRSFREEGKKVGCRRIDGEETRHLPPSRRRNWEQMEKNSRLPFPVRGSKSERGRNC